MYYLIPADEAPRNWKPVAGEIILTDADISAIENALLNLAEECEKDAADLAADDKANRATPCLQGMLRESAAKYRAALKKIQGE